jgi:hypothetical protein
VEGGALVSEALLSRAEGAEVLGGAGHDVGAESHLDAADGAASGSHIEEDDRIRHFFAINGGYSRASIIPRGERSVDVKYESILLDTVTDAATRHASVCLRNGLHTLRPERSALVASLVSP